MSTDHRSLEVLIQEMLDGIRDDEQRVELLKRVESDDAARKLYLDQIADQRALVLDLKVAPQKLDQLRLLVEAE